AGARMSTRRSSSSIRGRASSRLLQLRKCETDPPPSLNERRGTTPVEGMAVIVTGASRGIGRATALGLAELGADVALLQRSPAEKTVAAIEALGVRAHPVRVDLRDAVAAAAAVAEAADALGRLDAAVCNAGTIVRKPALELSLADWNETIALNLTGTF